MEALTLVTLVAILVEALVQVIKSWMPPDRPAPDSLWPLVGAGLGILLCILGQVDAFCLLGLNLTRPGVGPILTGILVSRGASFLHDVWSRARESSLV